jgi:hypothetical protein
VEQKTSPQRTLSPDAEQRIAEHVAALMQLSTAQLRAATTADSAYATPYVEPLAVRIAEAVKISGISETELYRRAARGEVIFRKVGGSTVVDFASLKQLVKSLPVAPIRTGLLEAEPTDAQREKRAAILTIARAAKRAKRIAAQQSAEQGP